jgi:hypothetical protein
MTDESDSDVRARPSSLDLTSTVQLVARAQQGDQSAVEQQFSRHAAPLRRLQHRVERA